MTTTPDSPDDRTAYPFDDPTTERPATEPPTTEPPTTEPPTTDRPPTFELPTAHPVTESAGGDGDRVTDGPGSSTATRVITPDRPAPELVPEHSSTHARRTVRMRTVVLGLVLLVVAGAVLISELTTVSVDPAVVVLALMIGCGVLLIAGARRS